MAPFRNIIYIIFIGILVCPTAMAQRSSAASLLKEADNLWNVKKAGMAASEKYAEAADLDPKNLRANYMAGKTLMTGVHKDRAIKYLKRVHNIDPNYRADLLYIMGKAHQFSYEFNSAINLFIEYLEKLNLGELSSLEGALIPPEEVNKTIQECNFARLYVENPRNYNIENLGANVNSVYPDYGPTLDPEENILIFTSRRLDGNINNKLFDDKLPYEDVFISKKGPDGSWQKAENMGKKVNTALHDSNIALSSNAKRLYMYSDLDAGDIHVANIDIATGKVGRIKMLEKPVNSSYRENSCAESLDGQYLIFSSDRPGGLGGLDMYIATKKGDSWENVRNMGATINTPYDDFSPFIHPNGKTLFFSSDGHDNMGGYDIFRTEYDSLSSSWTEPVNMGYPVNTPDNDVFFIVSKDGERGYLSSVREDGRGYTDIYEVLINVEEESEEEDSNLLRSSKIAKVDEAPGDPKANTETSTTGDSRSSGNNAQPSGEKQSLKPINIVIKLEDSQSKAMVDATKVTMKSFNSNVSIAPKRLEDGSIEFSVLNKKAQDYILSAEADGYSFRTFKVQIPGSTYRGKTIVRSIPMQKIRKGLTQTLRNIYFNTDSAELKQASYSELNKLENLLRENPDMHIELIGHTDAIGSDSYNMVLSRNRARSVAKYLESKGIKLGRIEIVGMGKKQPLASNDDERDGRELNRRVEFKILK